MCGSTIMNFKEISKRILNKVLVGKCLKFESRPRTCAPIGKGKDEVMCNACGRQVAITHFREDFLEVCGFSQTYVVPIKYVKNIDDQLYIDYDNCISDSAITYSELVGRKTKPVKR